MADVRITYKTHKFRGQIRLKSSTKSGAKLKMRDNTRNMWAVRRQEGCVTHLNLEKAGILHIPTSDGRNRARVIAESLARVFAAMRITSVRWQSHLPPNTEIGPSRQCVRCAAIPIARLAFTRETVVPHRIAEWPARDDRVRWTLAIGNWQFCPFKIPTD